MPSQEKDESVFKAILQLYRKYRGVATARPRSEQNIPAVERAAQVSSGFESPAPSRYFFDASLLFHCMDMLQVDRRELARDDPLLFRELQGVCALCRSKEECAQDLACEFDDARWDKWWLYCPNSATLTMIGAVQNCGDAARHLKMPHATTLSNLH